MKLTNEALLRLGAIFKLVDGHGFILSLSPLFYTQYTGGLIHILGLPSVLLFPCNHLHSWAPRHPLQ